MQYEFSASEDYLSIIILIFSIILIVKMVTSYVPVSLAIPAHQSRDNKIINMLVKFELSQKWLGINYRVSRLVGGLGFFIYPSYSVGFLRVKKVFLMHG